MANLEQLLAALGGGQQTIQKQNMYPEFSNLANQIGGIAVQSASPKNMKEAILASAISGLVGGVTGQLGANYEAKQQGLYQNALLNALSGAPAAKPEGMSDALYQNAQTAAQSFQMQDDLAQRLQMRQLQNAVGAEAGRTLMSNPQAASQVLSQLFGVEVNPARPIVDSPESTADRGLEGRMIDDISKETQALINQGTPPAQAAVLAREAYTARRDQLKNSYKELDEVIAQTNGLRALTENLERYTSEAGATGSGGNIRQMGAKILGEFGNTEQANKAAAGEALSSLSADIVRTARQVGSGPMSDRDVQLYLSAGPRLTNSPEGNKQILDRYRQALTLQDKYVDYMYEAQRQGVSITEAKKNWNDQRRANPYFIKQDDRMLPNPFWTGGAEARPASPPMEQGIPVVKPAPTAQPTREQLLAELERRRAAK
jgi:hypothetical protein